jgi:hypothetical protein
MFNFTGRTKSASFIVFAIAGLLSMGGCNPLASAPKLVVRPIPIDGTSEVYLRISSRDERRITITRITINGRKGDENCDFSDVKGNTYNHLLYEATNKAEGRLPISLSMGGYFTITAECGEFANVTFVTDKGTASIDAQ